MGQRGVLCPQYPSMLLQRSRLDDLRTETLPSRLMLDASRRSPTSSLTSLLRAEERTQILLAGRPISSSIIVLNCKRRCRWCRRREQKERVVVVAAWCFGAVGLLGGVG